jgi:hypothetical protein
MRIQAGDFCECDEGEAIYRAARCDTLLGDRLRLGGYTVNDDGTGVVTKRQIVTRIVAVTPILPFELKAGQKYDLDNGEVVTLENHINVREGYKHLAPFQFRVVVAGKAHYYIVTPDGLCVESDDSKQIARIVAEHVEPKPPTNAEKLESAIDLLASARKDDEAFALIREVVADLKAK